MQNNLKSNFANCFIAVGPGLNLSWVSNSISGHTFMSSTAKLSNLELKTWPKQLLGSLLPGIALSNEMISANCQGKVLFISKSLIKWQVDKMIYPIFQKKIKKFIGWNLRSKNCFQPVFEWKYISDEPTPLFFSSESTKVAEPDFDNLASFSSIARCFQ